MMTSINDSFNNNTDTITIINMYSNPGLTLIQIKDWKDVTLNRIQGMINILIDWSFQANDVKHILYGIDDKEIEWIKDNSQELFDLYYSKFKESITDLKQYSPKLEVALRNFYTEITNWLTNFKLLSLMHMEYEKEIWKRKSQFKESKNNIENIFNNIIEGLSGNK